MTDTTQEPKVVSTVIGDMFCAGCGYNMRGQNVFIDPHTRLQVIRCPECSRYHASTSRQLWTAKLLMGAGYIWIFLLLAFYVGTFCCEILTAFFIGFALRTDAPTGVILIPTALLAMSPLITGFVISAATSTASIITPVRVMLIRSAAYAAIIASVGFLTLPKGPNAGTDLTFAVIAAIVTHAVLSIQGGLAGKPIMIYACRTLLPHSIQPHVLSYWNIK